MIAAFVMAAAMLPATVIAHHPLSNVTSAEQAAFDRGLTLYYAYNGTQGVHVFQNAVQADPKFAMGYWGLALSYGPDINVDLTEEHFKRAHAAIESAVALESTVSPEERSYIEAMRARYAGSWPDHEKDDDAYRAAMASAVAKYANDDDLAALYVESLLEKYGRNAWKARNEHAGIKRHA